MQRPSMRLTSKKKMASPARRRRRRAMLTSNIGAAIINGLDLGVS